MRTHMIWNNGPIIKEGAFIYYILIAIFYVHVRIIILTPLEMSRAVTHVQARVVRCTQFTHILGLSCIKIILDYPKYFNLYFSISFHLNIRFYNINKLFLLIFINLCWSGYKSTYHSFLFSTTYKTSL